MTGAVEVAGGVGLLAALALALGGALLLGQGAALATTTIAPEEDGNRGGAECLRTLVNTAPIVGPEAGPASPFPSTIEVSGMTGTILDVNLFLNGIEGGFAGDLDVMLVGPDGDDALVLSDANDQGSARVNLVLDDEANRPVPGGDQPLTSGTFRPTDIDRDGVGAFDDDVSPPAPTFALDSALSEFDGTDPNGTWRLFVHDDEIGEAVRIADGSRLEITTAAAPAAKDDAFKVEAGKTLRRRAPGVLANNRDPDDEDPSARLVSGPRHGKLNLKPDGSFVYGPNRSFVGTDSFVYETRDERGLADRAKVTITVKGKHDRARAPNASGGADPTPPPEPKERPNVNVQRFDTCASALAARAGRRERTAMTPARPTTVRRPVQVLLLVGLLALLGGGVALAR